MLHFAQVVEATWADITDDGFAKRTNLEKAMLTRTFYLSIFVLMISVCAVEADTVGGQQFFTNSGTITDVDNQIMSTISIAETGIITDISVTLEGVNHSEAGDLIAELRFLGAGGPTEPAFIFFRPNVDGAPVQGSLASLNGNYTFTSDNTDADFWAESSLPDDESVPTNQEFFFSDEGGDFNDLSSSQFFGGQQVQGPWQLVITDANAFGNNEGSVQSWSIEFETIPEPSTALVLCGLGTLVAIRRRK